MSPDRKPDLSRSPVREEHTYLPNRASGANLRTIYRLNPLSLADGGLPHISKGTLGERANAAKNNSESTGTHRQDPSLQ